MRRNLVSPVFVGRAAELGMLTAAIDAAVDGEPSVVLVSGEAGVGKTRLADEGRRPRPRSGRARPRRELHRTGAAKACRSALSPTR
jgi:predicted ATPase